MVKKVLKLVFKIVNLVLIGVVIVMGVKLYVDKKQTQLYATAAKNVIELSQQPTQYETVLAAFDDHSVLKQWAESMPDAANARQLEIGISVRNDSRFDAEWIGAEVSPLAGDVALYKMEGTEITVPSGASSVILLRLITTEPAENTRKILISYYIRGEKHSFTVKA